MEQLLGVATAPSTLESVDPRYGSALVAACSGLTEEHEECALALIRRASRQQLDMVVGIAPGLYAAPAAKSLGRRRTSTAADRKASTGADTKVSTGADKRTGTAAGRKASMAAGRRGSESSGTGVGASVREPEEPPPAWVTHLLTPEITALMAACQSDQRRAVAALIGGTNTGIDVERGGQGGDEEANERKGGQGRAGGEGVNVTLKTRRWGRSALAECAWYGRTGLLRVLLKSGATPDVNKADIHGLTPMFLVRHHYSTLPADLSPPSVYPPVSICLLLPWFNLIFLICTSIYPGGGGRKIRLSI